ncbi:MAG: efflux RND transporter permease subunit [Syntrophomonadaceae bacterium]
MINLTEWAVKHKSLIYFFIILVFIVGGYSYQSLGRMEDPDFTVRKMVVTVAWPGASAQQMEEQVADKIEKTLLNTPGLDYISSYSIPGQSYIFVNLDFSVEHDKIQSTWQDVRNMVNDIKDTLPDGVYGPYFNDKFSDVYGSVYAINGDGYSYEEMRAEAEKIRRILREVDNVKRVELVGVQPEKIYIEIESSKLAKLGVSPSAIIATLQGQNAMTPAGMFATSSDNVYLRVSGMFDNIEDIRDLPIRTNDGTLRLGDIAPVQRSYTDPIEPKMYHNGKPSVGLILSMAEGGNVLTLGKDLNRTIGEIRKDLPAGLEINQVADQPEVVKESINEFVITLLIAVGIILIVCLFTLGIKTGAVVAIVIPLVIAGVFAVMKGGNIALQRVSLGALIVAIGLLVDDAIIILESMKVKIDEGWERTKAAGFAYLNTAKPMLTGTLVTCAGFIPVGFSQGSAAEFVGSLFWVVTIALVISWIVAIIVTPVLGYGMIEVKAAHQEPGFDLYDTGFYRYFRQVLNRCLEHRRVVLILTAVLFMASIFLIHFIKQDFFPASVRPELILDFRLPPGSSIQATDQTSKQFATHLGNDPDIVNYSYYVGKGAPRFILSHEPVLPSSDFAQFVIVAKDLEARERVAAKIDNLLTQFPAVEGRYRSIQIGPPATYPVMLRVSGYDHDRVRNIAEQVRAVMASEAYLRDVNMDWEQKSKVVQLAIDQDKARLLGVDSQSLASFLQAQLSGVTIDEFREKDKTVGLVFRLESNSRNDLADIKELNTPLSSGQYVPLDQIAQISYGAEEGVIWRHDLKPTITVQADVQGDITGMDATKSVYQKLEDLRRDLPAGYSIEMAGAAETSRIALSNLVKAVPLMVVVIIILLMLQLESMPKMILTLLTAPLGMIGVTPALLITNHSLAFVTYCGILALAGIIIRNSVILIDQIDKQLEQGESTWNAIVNAAVLRFRPIMLTALAAILGMIPLMTSIFWGSMAVAIAGGLLVATILTLLVLPAMYAAWYEVTPEVEMAETGN